MMAGRTVMLKCEICGMETRETAETVGEAVEQFTEQGWVFGKYQVLCPICRQKKRDRLDMEYRHARPVGAVPEA